MIGADENKSPGASSLPRVQFALQIRELRIDELGIAFSTEISRTRVRSSINYPRLLFSTVLIAEKSEILCKCARVEQEESAILFCVLKTKY